MNTTKPFEATQQVLPIGAVVWFDKKLMDAVREHSKATGENVDCEWRGDWISENEEREWVQGLVVGSHWCEHCAQHETDVVAMVQDGREGDCGQRPLTVDLYTDIQIDHLWYSYGVPADPTAAFNLLEKYGL